MSWTDERVELLKKLWTDGQSASQIAKELGGVTRNAVIGKVHRLGLSNRVGAGASGETETAEAPAPAAAAPAEAAAEVSPAAAPAQEAAEQQDVIADENGIPMSAARRAIIPAGQPLPPQPSANEISPEALAKVNEVEKTARRLSLMELTEKTCKWPVGDPATDNFWFCGLPSQAGKPYCEAHVGVAFQPMSSRRDRRR
ncbi:MAG: GcrA cell cycle regulator [Limimaricola sp.]|uniref:GcrA family cell cycle regulator n=1 Tax=Limimaricola sp. TaxID=2211665 RepID=UPI001E0946AF|nr:GcrA family cell cycle regulator [Limimaricola sp.]MBI1415865.1 GcrA cell cycle regulator [Limimaricola sp.]